MKIFDSQKKITWSSKKGDVKAPFRLGRSRRVSAEIGQATVSEVKIIGNKVSGDGAVNFLIKDGKKVILSKTFKFTKTSLSEICFQCSVSGSDLRVCVARPTSSSGTIIISRILLNGELPSAKRLKKEQNNPGAIDYAKMTERLTRSLSLAVIIPYGIYGGGEVYIKNLISSGHKDFNIDVLFLGKNRLQKELEGCPVKAVNLGDADGLRSYLRLDRYDAVVFYNSKKVYDVLREKKLQENFSADIIEIYHSDFLWADAIAKVRHRECVDKLFRVSDGLAQDITGISDQNKITIPVGVDQRRFEEDHVWPNDVREDYKRTIGMVARLSPEKNINYAMSIMKMLPDFQLVVLGSGPLRSKLEQRRESEGINNVFFVGYKERVEPYYNIFDALLLTSRIEGTPISIVEALMSGVPVFTTPVGQIEENYEGLSGVNMLSGKVDVDAGLLSSFEYDSFNGDNMKSFSKNKHGLDHIRDLFFSGVLNSLLSFSLPADGVFVLDGEYV